MPMTDEQKKKLLGLSALGEGIAILWLLLRKKPAAGGVVLSDLVITPPSIYSGGAVDISCIATNYGAPSDAVITCQVSDNVMEQTVYLESNVPTLVTFNWQDVVPGAIGGFVGNMIGVTHNVIVGAGALTGSFVVNLAD